MVATLYTDYSGLFFPFLAAHVFATFNQGLTQCTAYQGECEVGVVSRRFGKEITLDTSLEGCRSRLANGRVLREDLIKMAHLCFRAWA